MTGPRELPPSPPDLEEEYFPRVRPPRAAGEDIGTPGSAGVGAVAAAPLQGIMLPPDQFRPGPQSVEVFAISPPGISIGPGPGAVWPLPVGVPPGIITRIPVSHVGRLAVFGVQVLGLLATSLITFRLRVNGAGVSGWGQTQIAAAPLAVSQVAFDIYTKLPRGAVIDVDVQVDDAGVYPIQVYYSGWSYPAEYDALYARGFGAG
jgi:hypothetical protein